MIDHEDKRKIIVISGAAGYVGSVIAKQLAADGFRIAALYHSASEKEISALLQKLSGLGHRAYACNLTDEEAVIRTIDQVEQDLGAIYACVHAAGKKPQRKHLHLVTLEEMRDQFETNVFGSFTFLGECAKRLKA